MTKAIHDLVMKILSGHIELADQKIDHYGHYSVDRDIYRNEAMVLRTIRDEIKQAIKEEFQKHDPKS